MHYSAIVVINVRGFYNPLRELIHNGIEAGFITAVNANLVRFVDGPTGIAEQEAFDWGKAALDVLDNWTFPPRTHFYDWSRTMTIDGEKTGDALDAI